MKQGEKAANLLITRKMPESAEVAFSARFAVTLNPDDKPLGEAGILAGAQGKDGLVVTSMDKLAASLITALPASVRIISTVSAGFEHIDLAAASARGITVTNTPGVLTEATADIALLLLLGAARGAFWGERMVREERWGPPSIVHPLGLDVAGQRLGILGMGRIGQAVARRAKAFGMELHYHNRRPVTEAAELGAVYHARLEDMLPNCDFLSINCALNAQTRHLINRQKLDLLPPHAVVVNTARGDIVADDDLITALETGRIAAAGLDVFSGEPAIDPRYRGLPNVFLLPHLGSATPRTRLAMAMKALDNVRAYFEGRRPPDTLT
jgi:glyoxylate reductase